MGIFSKLKHAFQNSEDQDRYLREITKGFFRTHSEIGTGVYRSQRRIP